jgi:hypothetical protein
MRRGQVVQRKATLIGPVARGTRYEIAKFKVSHWLEFESERFEADTRRVDMRQARPIESILSSTAAVAGYWNESS